MHSVPPPQKEAQRNAAKQPPAWIGRSWTISLGISAFIAVLFFVFGFGFGGWAAILAIVQNAKIYKAFAGVPLLPQCSLRQRSCSAATSAQPSGCCAESAEVLRCLLVCTQTAICCHAISCRLTTMSCHKTTS